MIAALLLTPTAVLAQDEPAPTENSAPPQPLTIFTTFPAQVIGLDATVSIPLKVRAGTSQTVQLAVEDVPADWQVSFRGSNRTVSAVFVDGATDVSVDLRIDPPATTTGGVYRMTVVATGETESARLPLTLTVEEKAPPSITLDTDLPTVRGKPNTTFRFNVTLKNEGADDLNVNLTADAPPV
ncbi:MAG: hypothetical protein ACK4SA_18820, partial [Caldilinea sp.]